MSYITQMYITQLNLMRIFHITYLKIQIQIKKKRYQGNKFKYVVDTLGLKWNLSIVNRKLRTIACLSTAIIIQIKD